LVEAYTAQLEQFDKPSPLVVTTLILSKSLQPWVHDTNTKCEVCNMGGELVSCSFCNVAYHNTCLSEPISKSLLASESYQWSCAECFKEAVRSHKRKKVLPGGGKRSRS